MTRYVPSDMTETNRTRFLDWIRAHDEDPNTIMADHFRVHNGRMSGRKFILSETGERLLWGDELATVPFTRLVAHPLPEFDDPKTGIYSV